MSGCIARSTFAYERQEGVVLSRENRAFLPMMYLMRRRFSGDKEHDGEGVLGRFASEDWGGVRPEGRESAGVGGTVLRELCLGVEDFLAKAADRADGAGGAAVRQAHG